MFINHSSKQVTAKIVYYGPGLSGKTTNLQYIFSVTNPRTRGELVSIETDVERTLFFDLLPINVGLVNGYQTKFQLYTVPGQVFYDSTRQLVLKGADGVVFVADSQELMENANKESLENLRVNLSKQNQDIREIPVVFQYNKQDLQNTYPADRLNKRLNILNSPYYGAIAVKGTGVIETLREISSMTLKKIKGLLDQSLEVDKKRAFVKFDTDEKHEIIKREELPLKKVSVKTVEDFHNKISFADDKEKNLPLSREKTRIEEKGDVLDLGGFEQLEPVKEVATGTRKAEIIEEIPELKGFDDPGAVEDIPEIPEIPGYEKIEDIPELVGFDDDEIQIELDDGDSLNMTEVKEYDDTKEFDDVVEPMGQEELKKTQEAQNPVKKEAVKADRVLKPVPPQKVEPPPPRPPQPQQQPQQKVELPPKPIRQIMPPPVPKPSAPPPPKPPSTMSTPPPKKPSKPNVLDLLDRLKDETRVTIIKKIKKSSEKDTPVVIEIKDKDVHLLEPIKVIITPGTKKITLILDVTR